jgi:uncharacterized protein YdeI (YjbR/CyaY-like superfamily)
MNNVINSMFGTAPYTTQGQAATQINQSQIQAINYGQQMAGSYAQQAHAAKQQQTQALQALLMQHAYMPPKDQFMINGRSMSFEAWLDELAPGEDNSMRTFLILKYKGQK